MSSWRVRLGAIACLAFAIRLAYVVFVAPKTSGIFDAFYFQQVGHLVADGHGFISPYEFISKGRSVPSAEHPPLYTLLLAGESWLGATDDTLQRTTGALLGALTVALCGLLGRRIGGDRVGLIAAGLAAVYPLLIVPDGALLSETLYLPLIAGALLAAYRLLDRPNATSAALLGALIGLAALTRAEALLLLLLLAPVAALRGGSGWPKRLTLCVVTALLVMTPWVVRNWTVFDRPLISNNEGGLIGQTNCHRAYYGSGIGFLSTNCLPPQRTPDEARRAALFREKGLDYAEQHLGRLVVVMPIRLLRAWGLYAPGRAFRDSEGRNFTVQAVGVVASWILIILAVLGALRLRRRGEPLLLLLAPVIMVCLVAALTYGSIRLRVAAEVPLVVLAAVGLGRFSRR